MLTDPTLRPQADVLWDKFWTCEVINSPIQEEFAGVVARVESLHGMMSEAGRRVPC